MAEKLYNCVGFMITRVHETGADASRRRRRYATLWSSAHSDPSPSVQF